MTKLSVYPAGRAAFSVIGLSMVGLLAVGCVPQNPDRPTTDELVVTATVESDPIPAGTGASLSANASGGEPPYVFRWDLNDSPEDSSAVAFVDDTAADTQTEAITTPGAYQFRVIATDAAGVTGTAFVQLQVDNSLTVTLTSDSSQVFEGSTVTLTADAVGANEPVTFGWELVSGPVELDLSQELAATLTTESLTQTGTFTFAVTVTDDAGVMETATVDVEVVAALTASVPPIAVVGAPVELSAAVEQNASLTVAWSIESGTGSFDDATSLTPMLTTENPETVDVRLTATLSGEGGGVSTRDFELVSVADLTPRVLIEVRFGDDPSLSDMILEFDAERAPTTTASFLLYADEGFFDGLIFHRAACSSGSDSVDCDRFVLQGGGFEIVDGEPTLREPTRDPVMSEAGNGLSSGTLNSVAMALTSAGPDSGTTQFFLNLTDNSFLDDQQFTVFGQLVEGSDVVDAIFALDKTTSAFAPQGEVSLPVIDVIMERVSRVAP